MTVHPVFALILASLIQANDSETSTLSAIASPAPVASELKASSSMRVGFTIEVEGYRSDLSVFSTSVMPGGDVHIKADANLISETGDAREENGMWTWTAPDTPGHHEIFLTRNDETIRLNVFVLTPFSNGQMDSINGYRVGAYNPQPLRGLDNYLPPTGFIDMQPGMEDIQIAPNFKLGQFICKQQPGHDPTYLLVEPGMLLKLQALLEAANEKGWEADTFFIMSGFRTPFYNAAIGNTTTSSRHLFGDASDIYIDHDRDGVMDDLNGDNKITKADAVALAELAREVAEADKTNWPSGGIGIYDANAVHGPFVHIDARGYPARWG